MNKILSDSSANEEKYKCKEKNNLLIKTLPFCAFFRERSQAASIFQAENYELQGLELLVYRKSIAKSAQAFQEERPVG